MRLSLKPIFSKLDALILSKETTIEEVYDFFKDNHKKIQEVKKANGAFTISFTKDFTKVLCSKSVLFFNEGNCYYIVAEDSELLMDFYKPYKGKKKEIISKQNQERFQCPSCSFIHNVRFDACPNCGATANSCAEELAFTDVTTKLKREKLMPTLDIEKIVNENPCETSTEVTAVYGDNISVKKDDVDEGEETSNL